MNQPSKMVRRSSLRVVTRTLCLLALMIVAAASQAHAADAATLGPQPASMLASVNLRGYGTIFAEMESVSAERAKASVLRITCQSRPKAELVLAKYLSDLRALPGVTAGKLAIGGGRELPGWQVTGQGWILAALADRTVVIVAGEKPPAVRRAAERAFARGVFTFTPSVSVPAYLDKWDKHGWSFYNWLWHTPDKKEFPQLARAGYDFSKPYDYSSEYEWAARNHTGMVYDMYQFSHDRGAGMNDYADFTWATQACHRYGLDFQIQPDLNDNMPWWANRYRAETIGKMPGYVGNFHSINDPRMGAAGLCSWCSIKGKDELLALAQQLVRRYAGDPNCSTIMEPHNEEGGHGDAHLLIEFGPLADASYRRYLWQERRLSLPELSSRYGQRYASWDEVRVPELAFFLGGGAECLDLTGTWKVREAGEQEGVKQRLFATDVDTRGWGQIVAPGHDRQMFLKKEPRWFRRAVEIPGAWAGARQGKPLYLYLWDLNKRDTESPVLVYWDGAPVARDVRESGVDTTIARRKRNQGKDRPAGSTRGIGITIARLSESPRAGRHTLAVHLPQGFIGYRVYLSTHEPVSYPRLGKAMNARWVDFRDWQTWFRVDGIRRGLEAIRGVDHDRPISMAAPDDIIDYAKDLAVTYGGFFHNTGYMSGWFADLQPRLMRNVGLPSSAEPGGPAKNLAQLKQCWWRIALEGVASYNYFIHIGSILWDPEMKAWFESQQPMIHLLGKYHLPPSRVAGLTGVRCERLKGWPWYRDEATTPSGGYWGADVSGLLDVPADLLTEHDGLGGMLGRYDLVYDEQTSIMSPELVRKIADWVKAGGTFVTLVQTGRHTEDQADAWPIRALTGCDVLWTSKVKPSGEYEWKPVSLEPGQKVFDTEFWSKARLAANGIGLTMPGDDEYRRPVGENGQLGLSTGAGPGNLAGNGLGLKPGTPDVQPLMRWKQDHSLAVGLRRLGKGRVFIVGLKFFNDRPWSGAPALQAKFVNDILAYCGYRNQDDARVDSHLISGQTKDHDAPLGRHLMSNNGLYDVYLVCNQGQDAKTMTLSLPRRAVAWAWDVAARRAVTPTAEHGRMNYSLAGMAPDELRAVLVPRGDICRAPAEWLKLQSTWWRGGDAPGKVLTPDRYDDVVDLSDGWTLTPMRDDRFAAAGGPPLRNVSLGPWTYLVHSPVKNAIFSRDIVVPSAWTNGNVYLHVSSRAGTTFLDQGRVLLDDREVRRFNSRSVELALNDLLRPGSKHKIALQIKGGPFVQGLRGTCWLEYEPRAAHELSLAGLWEPSPDALSRTAPVKLPGEFAGLMARTTVRIPKEWQGQTVMIHALGGERSPALLYVITNGKMCRRHHHIYGPRLDLNITPYLKFGSPNEIEVVAKGAGTVTVRELSLRAYPPAGNSARPR